MKKEIVRKSLIFGTIILLIGASVLPVVNAKQIQNQLSEKSKAITQDKITIYTKTKNVEKNGDECGNPIQGPILILLNVEVNITFYGNTTNHGARIHAGPYWPIVIAYSYDKSVTPVANITATKKGIPYNITCEHSLFLVMRRFKGDIDLDLGKDPDGGYINGTTSIMLAKL